MAHSKPKGDLSEKDIFAISGKSQIKFCQPCNRKDKQTDAKFFCTDCVEYQCSDCSVAHKVFSFALNHNVVSEKEAGKFTVSYDMKGLDQCKLHNKLLEIFCVDDNQLCCSTCAIIGHRKCRSVVELEQKASSAVRDIKILKQELSTTAEKAKALAHSLTSKRNKFASDAFNVKDQIQNMKGKAKVMFEQWEISADEQIASFQQQVFQDYDNSVSSCKSCRSLVSQVLSELQSVSENGTPSQQFIFAHHLKDQVMKLKQNADKESEAVREAIVSIHFDDILKLPPTENRAPWYISTKFADTTQNSSYQHVNTKTDLKLLNSFTLHDDDSGSFSGIDFLPDGRLVCVHYVEEKCVVFNQQLQIAGSTALLFGPLGVATVSEQEVVITSGNGYKVYFAHVSESNKVTVTRSIDVLKCYESICIMNSNDFLVRIQNNIPAVGIISKNGKEKDLDVKIPLRRYPLFRSACCFIRNGNKVVLVDQNADTVYICDIVNNTSLEIKADTIQEPLGLAVGPNDSVFVCCQSTNFLVHISSEGKILASYKLGISYPQFVCVSKDNTKLAVFNGSNMFQLYDINT